MLDVKKMVESAEECLGWPYVTPGTNDSRGIDCSGMFVKIYKDQGAKIAHGSNTIFREYCSETGVIQGVKDLKVGMAVFKLKKWTENDKDNRWYGTEPGNLSHIGIVTSVNPLVITHATTPCVKQDKKIGNWKYWGRLKAVNYEDGGETAPEKEETILYTARLMGGNTNKPIHIRIKPDGMLLDDVPQGTAVEVIRQETGKDCSWCEVRYPDGNRKGTGYVKSEFVIPDGEIPAEDAGYNPAPPEGGYSREDETVTVSMNMTAAEAQILLPMLDQLAEQIAGQIGRG